MERGLSENMGKYYVYFDVNYPDYKYLSTIFNSYIRKRVELLEYAIYNMYEEAKLGQRSGEFGKEIVDIAINTIYSYVETILDMATQEGLDINFDDDDWVQLLEILRKEKDYSELSNINRKLKNLGYIWKQYESEKKRSYLSDIFQKKK